MASDCVDFFGIKGRLFIWTDGENPKSVMCETPDQAADYLYSENGIGLSSVIPFQAAVDELQLRDNWIFYDDGKPFRWSTEIIPNRRVNMIANVPLMCRREIGWNK